MAGIQLMWACGITACALRITSGTHSPTSEGWTAEFAVGLWLVVPMTGIRTHASRPDKILNTEPGPPQELRTT